MDPAEAQLTLDVRRRLGPVTKLECMRAIDAVGQAFAEILTADEARAVAARVPRRFAGQLTRSNHRRAEALGLADLVEIVAHREAIDRALALEHLTAVCESVSALLPHELREQLMAHLPLEVAALIERRLSPAPAPRATPPPPPPLDSLALGHPASRHPLSEARPDRAQLHSVARDPEPHADRKMSSSRGANNLATGRSRT